MLLITEQWRAIYPQVSPTLPLWCLQIRDLIPPPHELKTDFHSLVMKRSFQVTLPFSHVAPAAYFGCEVVLINLEGPYKLCYHGTQNGFIT